ncbi:hypothetical protein SAMN05519104_1882 [Rhizobiales bacterium GAS188]|nr:hypothetical protein SAMN05519104_1882 [Rhizobiales bacterium GAS188]
MRLPSWPRDRRCRWLLAANIVAASLAPASGPALAQGSCPGISPSTEPKFVISRLVAAGLKDADQIKAANYAYQAALHLAVTLSAAWNVPIDVVQCGQRAPNVDGSDFAPDVVRELNGRNVLFEMWGNLSTSQAGGKATAEGLVVTFVFPMLKSGPPWPQTARLTRAFKAKAVPMKDMFTSMFTQGRHFEVFAAVAFGMTESRNNRFDSAQKALCQASLALQQSRGDPIWSDLGLDTKTLGPAIDALLQNNIDAAKKDTSYRGSLTSPATQPASGRICPSA